MPAVLPKFRTLRSLSRDGRLLLATRFVRMFLVSGGLKIVYDLLLYPSFGGSARLLDERAVG
jgi:hypothetical protein